MSGDNGGNESASDSQSRGNLAASLGIGGAGTIGGGGLAGTSAAASSEAAQGTGFRGQTSPSGGYTGTDEIVAGMLSQSQPQIKRNVAEAAEYQGVQDTMQRQSFIDKALSNKFLQAGAAKINPFLGGAVKLGSAFYTPDTEADLMNIAVARFEEQGGADPTGTGNIAMRSNMGDPFGSNVNRGQHGVFGPGKIHRDPSGNDRPVSPLEMLIQNSITGLSPDQVSPEQAPIEAAPAPFNPLWEALIPTLKIRGNTLADIIASSQAPPAIGGLNA